jgi:hypothetical protein
MGTRSIVWFVMGSFCVPAAVLAQDGEAAEDAPPAATTTGGSEVVDDRQAELERMQREVESDEQPEPTAAVVEPAPAAEERPEESMSHEQQVGLRLGAGVPFIFAVKYGDGPVCGDDLSDDGTPAEFCRHFGAALLDLEIAYGLSDTVELSVLARFGLTDDEAADSNPLAFGIGARAYTSAHAMFKAFLGGRVMLDATSSDTPEWSSVDVGARGELGLQFDVVRYVGLYAQIGASIMILRALSFAFDATGGVQARFP